MKKIFSHRLVYHSLIWLTIIAGLFFVGERGDGELDSWQVLVEIVAFLVMPLMVAVYLHFWAFDHLFLKRKYWQYGLALIFILGSAIGFQVWIEEASPMVETTPGQHFLNQTVLIALALGLRYLKRGTIGQLQLQRLKRENMEIELKALKAQLNPHFLFNTLNNIYAINQIDAEKGSEMILELSEVMRYHLQSSKLRSIKLADEIQLIESYVELEMLRLPESCKVELQIGEIKPEASIAPLLILPFVENAFKHGTHSQLSSFVKISIRTEEQLLIHIQNSVFPNKRVVRNQLGHENTLRRLELIYPDQHELEINAGSEVYEVKLAISL